VGLVREVVTRGQRAGVPVFTVDRPGPHQAALVFRVGRADETLATSGVTHLVEHLALFAVDDDLRRSGGFVDHFRTVFFTSGSPDEIAQFLVSVSGALQALPLDRVELEKQVLLTEAASAGGSMWQMLMGLRFGAEHFGLLAHDEVGLRRIDADEVARWCASRFVSANAAIWSTCPLPADLDLQLAPGKRFPPQRVMTLAGVPLPAYVDTHTSGVVLSALGSRSTALTVALSLLEQRVHRNLRVGRGLSYAVTGSYVPLAAHAAHVTFGADCLDEHAVIVRDEILQELRGLAQDGPGLDELSAEVEKRIEHWSQENTPDNGELDAAAMDELLGKGVSTRAELVHDLEVLTPDHVSRALWETLETIILCAPTGSDVPAGFRSYDDRTPHKPLGHRYLARGNRSYDLPKRSRIAASDKAISFVGDKSENVVTIRYADVVAVLEHGPGRMTVVDRSGSSIRLDLNSLVKGAQLNGEIRRTVPPYLFVPLERTSKSILDVSRQQLGYRTRAATEIGRLPGYLQPGEQVVKLAVAVRRQRRGLVALTDRRLLFLAKAASRKPRFIEVPLTDIVRVKKRLFGVVFPGIVVTTKTGKHRFADIVPRERAAELIQELTAPGSTTSATKPFDDSLKGRLRDYLLGIVLVGIGLPAVLAHAYAAVWMLIFGVVRLVRTFGRRRDARAFQMR